MLRHSTLLDRRSNSKKKVFALSKYDKEYRNGFKALFNGNTIVEKTAVGNTKASIASQISRFCKLCKYREYAKARTL